MIIQQFFTKKIAHSSYFLGGDKECAIIDPRRDADIYIDVAREMGARITYILETHLHADFISGHMDLAERTGATICGPRSANFNFDHVPLAEGDSFKMEDMAIQVLETPGHTPEHISYVVTDMSRGDDAVALFCGDTLFVGDVGRPDLFPGRAEELASKLYDSLHGKIMRLPDTCEVYPAHGAGSLCGRAMAAKRTSTIGYEKKFNYALKISDRRKFIDSLTHGMPDAPDHFRRCTDINRQGPVKVIDLPSLEDLEPPVFSSLSADHDFLVLDVRNFEAFGGQHVLGAYSIDINGNFPTFAGWLLPPEKDILLVSEGYGQAAEASRQLHRVGLDRVHGYLAGGMYAWVTAGYPTAHVPQLSSHELNRRVKQGKRAVLVDVRASSEYENFHIQNAINIPVSELRER
ncbi:MAG: MBL fold metallo-hydrolase, partial [Methanomethylovorans sp.]|nr:MBL fold metallo-hydrolase [Methanomethylovorans sp.]